MAKHKKICSTDALEIRKLFTKWAKILDIMQMKSKT